MLAYRIEINPHYKSLHLDPETAKNFLETYYGKFPPRAREHIDNKVLMVLVDVPDDSALVPLLSAERSVSACKGYPASRQGVLGDEVFKQISGLKFQSYHVLDISIGSEIKGPDMRLTDPSRIGFLMNNDCYDFT